MGNSLSMIIEKFSIPLVVVFYVSTLGVTWLFGYLTATKNHKSLLKSIEKQSNHEIASQTDDKIDVASRTGYDSLSERDEQVNRRLYLQKEGIIVPAVDVTRRGQLWSKNPSWQLPLVAREVVGSISGIEHVAAILRKFDVDPFRGFLPSQDPLQRLQSSRYHLWEDLADDLPKLLGARLGQARQPLKHLPVLSTSKLVTDEDLRRAHLLLSLFAHAYVWGGVDPIAEIPKGIAIPLCEVSKRLDLPPVLTYASIVLYNWRRLDEKAAISMDNLSTLNNFFDGRDESWFYLITVEVEAKGAAAIVPIMLAQDAIQRLRDTEDEERSEETEARAGLDVDMEDVSTDEDCLDFDTDDSEIEESMRGSFFKCKQQQQQQSQHSNKTQPSLHPCGTTASEKSGRRRELHGDSSDSEDAGPAPSTAIHRNPSLETSSSTATVGMHGAILREALVGHLTRQRVVLYVTGQLRTVGGAIREMCASLASMREGCHPFIFYHRVRPFLSAWKQNPTLPHGVVYQGVQREPMAFYGGSAAQSSLIPTLDIALGIQHDNIKSKGFLDEMRKYMTKPHREFLFYLERVTCIREFVLEISGCSMSTEAIIGLRTAYDSCVEALQSFRTSHIALVADFIMAQQAKTEAEKKAHGMGNHAGGKGTGGTDLMKFLKPIRDNVRDNLLDPVAPASPPLSREDLQGGYSKDHGVPEDIDLYRGAAHYHMEPILWTQPARNELSGGTQ